MQGVQGDRVPLHNAAQAKIDLSEKYMKSIAIFSHIWYNY